MLVARFRQNAAQGMTGSSYLLFSSMENEVVTPIASFYAHYTSGVVDSRSINPGQDNAVSLGNGNNGRMSVIYAATGSIDTSDERLKDNIADPSDALMRAWGKVNFKVYQFKDAIEKKGENARIHVGVIAQQIQTAFASEGLDASRYGLFCHDEWGNEYEEREDGTRVLIRAAGDRYSVRYEECLALECAYQRWRMDRLIQQINEMESVIEATM
jgi:hypothetical protein